MVRRMVITLTGIGVAGLSVLFVLVGLDAADKLGSVLGALMAVVALGSSVAIWLADRPQAAPKYHVEMHDCENVSVGDVTE